MKPIRMFCAFTSLVFRSIATPIQRYWQYWHLKLKWWGKLRFNSSIRKTMVKYAHRMVEK